MNVDRQLGRGPRSFDCLQRSLDPGRDGAVVRPDIGIGEPAAKRALVFVEREAADPFRGCGNEKRAERTVGHHIADRLAATALSPCGWSHAKPLLGVRIEAAGRGISGVIHGFGHGLVLLEVGFGASRPDRPGIGCRRDAHVACENALEMMRCVADRTRQFGELKRLLGLLDELNGAGNRRAIASDLVRLASQAWTVAGGPRGIAVQEKLYILPLGASGRAARLAIDAGRLDRTDHSAIPAAVAALEGCPGRINVNCSHQHGPNIGGRPRSRFPWLAVKPKVGTLAWEFHEGELDREDVRALLAQHFSEMRAGSPPSACHVLPADGLKDPDIRFFTLRDSGALIGCGALKRLECSHGEIKSMRTADSALGRGVGKALLDHIVAAARREGMKRLSLETGSTQQFGAANRLYEREGFELCGPFGGYADTPFTRFFTKEV